MRKPDAKIVSHPTVEDAQRAAADYTISVLRETATGTDVRIALSGGSTPRRMHAMIAEADGIEWPRVHVYWGDERTVPPDDPASNYRMAHETLLAHVPIPDDNIHRMRGEIDPVAAARDYERVLRETFESADGIPHFDLLIQGMGADGHTASLFPGTAALEIRDRLCVANHVPQQDTWRITLTFPVINAGKRVLFLVTGADKADAFGQVMAAGDVQRPPAGWVQPEDGEVVWFVDDAVMRG